MRPTPAAVDDKKTGLSVFRLSLQICRHESVWVVKALVTKVIADFDRRPGSWVPTRLFANQPIPVRNLVDDRAGAIIKRSTVDFACQECHCLTPHLHNTSFNPGSARRLLHYLKTVAAKRQSPTGEITAPW